MTTELINWIDDDFNFCYNKISKLSNYLLNKLTRLNFDILS